jgi:hypothetical protein
VFFSISLNCSYFNTSFYKKTKQHLSTNKYKYLFGSIILITFLIKRNIFSKKTPNTINNLNEKIINLINDLGYKYLYSTSKYIMNNNLRLGNLPIPKKKLINNKNIKKISSGFLLQIRKINNPQFNLFWHYEIPYSNENENISLSEIKLKNENKEIFIDTKKY